MLTQHSGVFEHRDAVGNTLSYFLIAAASKGITEAFENLQNLIENNTLPLSSLTHANQMGKTPLHLVAQRFNLNLWHYLVNNGANPLLRDNNHQSSLDILTSTNPEAARWLQQRSLAVRYDENSDVDMRSNNDCSICLSAINIKGHITPCGHKFHILCMRPWLENNSETNQICPDCYQPVRLEQLRPFIPEDDDSVPAEFPSAPPAYLSYLEERDLPESTRSSGRTYLEEAKFPDQVIQKRNFNHRNDRISVANAQKNFIEAAKMGNISLMRRMLGVKGVDINAKDSDGVPAVVWAASEGKINVIQLLITESVDVNAVDNNGKTPAYWAACNGHASILEQSIDSNDVDVNKADKEGCPPLHIAAQRNNLDVLRILVESGKVDLNKVDNVGDSSLHDASTKDAIEILLNGDINVNLKNQDDETPLLRAINEQNLEKIQVLASSNLINLNSLNKAKTKVMRFPPFAKDIFSFNKSREMIKILAQNGYDLNVPLRYYKIKLFFHFGSVSEYMHLRSRMKVLKEIKAEIFHGV